MPSPTRVMLFTDTLGDVNGVSRFITNVAGRASASGRALRVVTSTRLAIPEADNIRNVPPVLAGKMPRYENLEAVWPRLGALRRELEGFSPTVVHVSTPGPVGLAGSLLARRRRIPLVGVYHTDFPAYIEHLFGDAAMTWACARFMGWFYRRFEAIFTRSREYAASLDKLGIAPERIVALRPGIDVEVFHARHRDPGVWARAGLGGAPARVLYVGRVSVEKDLPALARAWIDADRACRARGIDAELVIVGDGPYRAAMQRELEGSRARFLGFRHGPELSAIYASADLFVFPSTTDTLGQVVMEAQSSGLPVLVSDAGGPKEVVREGVTGCVLRAGRARDWAERIVELLADPPRRARMGAAAHESMREMSIARSFEQYWEVHEDVGRKTQDERAGDAR